MYNKQLIMNELLEKYKKVTLDEFRQQLVKLEKFVKDPQWLNTLKFDMTINPFLAEEIIEVIEKINIRNITEDILLNVREKCKKYMEKANSCQDETIKWLVYRKAYAYYGFNECIIEGSIITDNILKEFKEIYGATYLKKLKELDNNNPSVLTNFQRNCTNIEESKIAKLYLLMKKWQDDQHMFHKDILYPKFVEARKKFENEIQQYEYLRGSKTRNKIALIILDNIGVIPVNILSRFIIGGIREDLANVVGGKNLGLAILNAYQLDIPQNTFAISVKSLNEGNYKNHVSNFENATWAVRSSATVEDSKKQSFAGMFKSLLNINNSELLDAIEEVKCSVSSDRVLAYTKKFHTKRPYMSVVLQNYKEPSISGVWIGTDKEKGHLEWVEGNGEKLVSGRVKPIYENWTIKKETDVLTVGKDFIGELCKKNQKKLDKVADFEWCIIDSKIIWLQFRPVTKVIDSINYKDNINEIIGIPASMGIVEGKPQYLKDIDELSKFEEGAILLTDFTDPEWVPAMIKAKAIVTAEGGFLSHSAIIARELGIPCVTGIGYSNLEKLFKLEKITVNGNTGQIEI